MLKILTKEGLTPSFFYAIIISIIQITMASKPQTATVRVKDLSLAIKAMNTLLGAKEKGEMEFATSVYHDFEKAIGNFQCEIAKIRGKKRDSIKIHIQHPTEEERNFQKDIRRMWNSKQGS
tara:strand:+ start:628 stop:990 length:363 start_codon:yes stop_codon:yes gene_type:complete